MELISTLTPSPKFSSAGREEHEPLGVKLGNLCENIIRFLSGFILIHT